MKNKNTINSLFVFIVIFVCCFFTFSESLLSQSTWEVPSKYVNLKNENAGDKDADGIGKSLYNTHCKACHGSKGDGKGQKLKGIDIKIRSFVDLAFQKQSDGEIYYKAFNGRGIMPNFDKKIVESEDRWLLVNFLRTFKK